ncbi:MAG: glucans biosynthesis glucosyltransferase MdoH [Pirellula sp.]|nr:glucans biosynthesis glucosyltransferase MdoH [Pirellula sp.]
MRPFDSALPAGQARAILGILTLATTAAATWAFATSIAGNGLSIVDIASTAIFAILFVWVAMSFWMAGIGFIRLARRARTETSAESSVRGDLPPTVVVMPIYNEDPQGVFAGMRAVWESVQATGRGDTFDFYLLSDTTNPEVWLAEELAWARLQDEVDGARIYYRHRPRNISRKSGNLADFCRRWGSRYRYMIVLDADSVMVGATLVELVRRMEADPQLGILQAPPQPVNRSSLFARAQQFAASLYGPIFMEGFAWWSQDDGNYWGHNAIIRTDAFLRHCGLAPLPGKAPLGGEILSHDFVEAALMRRAGYKVRLAHDLEGSYEECPPTLVAFAQRDQRWCQGNLQHLRLIAARGLRPVSRFHFFAGVMSYLSSPIWLLFLTIGVVVAAWEEQELHDGDTTILGPVWIFVATMVMLLSPKVWAWMLLAFDRRRASEYGGMFRAGLGLMTEVGLSIIVAPIMMAFHSMFVVATFRGKKVHWNAQQRDESGISWRDAASAHWRQTVAGIAALVIVGFAAPALLPWLLPVLVGLILAIPLSVICSSVRWGAALKKYGILCTPEERNPPAVLRRRDEFVAQSTCEEPTNAVDSGAPSLFTRVVREPALLALHCSILEATDGADSATIEIVDRAAAVVRKGRIETIAAEDRRALLGDPLALGRLHRLAWGSKQ